MASQVTKADREKKTHQHTGYSGEHYAKYFDQEEEYIRETGNINWNYCLHFVPKQDSLSSGTVFCPLNKLVHNTPVVNKWQACIKQPKMILICNFACKYIFYCKYTVHTHFILCFGNNSCIFFSLAHTIVYYFVIIACLFNIDHIVSVVSRNLNLLLIY